MEVFKKIKHGAVIAYMENQPISPNEYYVTRLLKMIDYESMQDSRTGQIDYRCTCIDIQNHETISVYITKQMHHRLATLEECTRVGKRNSYVEFKEE